MEMKVAEQGDKRLILELPGEGVTVTNVLTGELWDDDNVSEAAHIKEHPYLANAKILVVTSRGKPETALDKAADRIIKQAEEFEEKFKEASKNKQ
jgi:DNA-directed RNA polymerase subunit L